MLSVTRSNVNMLKYKATLERASTEPQVPHSDGLLTGSQTENQWPIRPPTVEVVNVWVTI